MSVPCPVLDVVTLDRLADREAIEQLVGVNPDARYKRASLLLPGPDGVSRFDYFSQEPEKRVVELQRRILLREPWHAAYQVQIPKDPCGAVMRPITYTTALDAGLLYRLHDWLTCVAETRLNEVAIAYRPRRAMVGSIRAAMRMIRERRLYSVCVLDIKGFYDSLSWKRLHAVIGGLPADDDVKTMLHELVEIDVVDRRTLKLVPRSRGIAQGLSVSPVLANLFMADDFDLWASRKLRRLGAVVLRYADDIAVFAPSGKAADDARKIVFGQLQRLGLRVKERTGDVVDLLEPDAHVTWLGLSLATRDVGGDGRRALVLDVDPRKVEKKTLEIQGEIDTGLLSVEGVHERLEELRSFYRMTLSETTALRVVDRIKGCLVLAQVGSLSGCGPMGRKREEEKGPERYRRTIDPRERQTGEQHPGGRLSESLRPKKSSGNRDRCSKPSLHRLVRSSSGSEQDGSSKGLDDGYFVEVQRRGGHRPRSPGAPTGTRSAPPVPGGVEKVVTIQVRPRSPIRADVVVHGPEATTARFKVSKPESISTSEVYVWACVQALERLAGDHAVVLVVTDRTLAGLTWDGWKPHSVPLARALLPFEREVARLGVRLERRPIDRRREPRFAPWPWR